MEDVNEVVARAHMESLRLRAVRDCGVSPQVADRAVHVTRKALGDGMYDRLLRRRSERYFWTVARRLVARDGASSEARARFFLAAAVEDLRESGRTDQGIWEEVERGWGQRFPAHVLEECRQRLCAPALTA